MNTTDKKLTSIRLNKKSIQAFAEKSESRKTEA